MSKSKKDSLSVIVYFVMIAVFIFSIFALDLNWQRNYNELDSQQRSYYNDLREYANLFCISQKYNHTLVGFKRECVPLQCGQQYNLTAEELLDMTQFNRTQCNEITVERNFRVGDYFSDTGRIVCYTWDERAILLEDVVKSL